MTTTTYYWLVVMGRVELFSILVSCPIVVGLSSSSVVSRRDWFHGIFVGGGAAAVVVWGNPPQPADAVTEAAAELPLSIRGFTKLAPLGGTTSSSADKKSRNLSLTELADRLTRDLTMGATGQGGYIISGDLSMDIFRDDCIFLDPTNRVDSLSQYQKALTILFDKDRSVVELLGPLEANEIDHTIRATFRSRGFLKLPWNPYVAAYESDVLYKVGKDDGLIYEQLQTWSKSSYAALRESFTPTIFTPPPKSNLPPTNEDEPADVAALFDMVNGRRPEEYSPRERLEIGRLLDRIVSLSQPWNPEWFPGTWKLVYFEPGPDGGGVDRRIPFPEFPFNDQYQVFGLDNSVTNIGQLFGPNLFVRVLGTVSDVSPSSFSSPKRLQADITGGQVCWDGAGTQPVSSSSACLDLPIQGTGLFESLYLGQRLRILQNLNGTGARGIQIRMG